jgi:hypothetical protein
MGQNLSIATLMHNFIHLTHLFNQVILILLDIQRESYLKIYSIKQQNINKPHKKHEENIIFLINTWEKYKNNEISLNNYLITLGPRFCAKKL